MPELQPHIALDPKQGVVHTIRCTDILPMGESSNEFGSMAIVVAVEYTGEKLLFQSKSRLIEYKLKLFYRASYSIVRAGSYHPQVRSCHLPSCFS